MVENVSVDEIKILQDNNANFQIIDVREIAEYLSVRIPNSKLTPLSEFEQKINSINLSCPSYFLCGIGKRALKAAEYLQSLGHKNLYVIEGGIKAWIEAGYPVEQG